MQGTEFRGISYTHAGDSEAPRVPGTLGLRSQGFLLADDVVVAETFVSSYASDSSDFDHTQVAGITKGTTTCDDVVRKFGRPSMRAIPPATGDPDYALVIIYTFTYMKRPVLQFKSFEKSLRVACDRAGIVRDVSYSEMGDR